MKNAIAVFTIADVRKINDTKPFDLVELTPVSQRLIRETHFSASEINKAFAKARASLNAHDDL